MAAAGGRMLPSRSGDSGHKAATHLFGPVAPAATPRDSFDSEIVDGPPRRSEPADPPPRDRRTDWDYWARQLEKHGFQCCFWLLALPLCVGGIAYLDYGCIACENDATCDGLFGACVCTGNYLGEYCENSCGEFGQVNGSACVCSSGYTGTFCDRRPGEADSGLGAGWIALIILLIVGCVLVCGYLARMGFFWLFKDAFKGAF
eukprot:SAG22_NODE_4592_length_1223_cov_0.797153_1_plen_203_part_00